MTLSEKQLLEVALSIRERHFRLLREQMRETRDDLLAARRSRQRRAHLLRLARTHRLASCLKKLRPRGMTLEADCRHPFIIYENRATRGWLMILKERCRDQTSQWRRLKAESADPILANLKTLLEETELLSEHPLQVRWTLREIELEGVWIGDIEVTINLEEFHVHAWNLSFDSDTKGGYQHPHVASDGHICWNGYDEDAHAYHASGDFLALKDMIENMLRTYNSQSPYISLEDWQEDGETCGECGDRWPADDMAYSESFGESLCPNCRSWCERCDDCVPYQHYSTEMEACKRCVEQDSEVCALCLGLFWRDELTTVQMLMDGKKEAVVCCEDCRREYEDAQEEPEDTKEETDDERTSDDHTDGAGPLAPAVALPPVSQ